MRRASDIGRDHEVEYVATGVSTYDFNTVEREATRGITSYNTGFHCGALGCSISGQRCSAGNYVYTQTLVSIGTSRTGPYRSGTGDAPALIAENVRIMEDYALPVFRAGHIPALGEWLALPSCVLPVPLELG